MSFHLIKPIMFECLKNFVDVVIIKIRWTPPLRGWSGRSRRIDIFEDGVTSQVATTTTTPIHTNGSTNGQLTINFSIFNISPN